MEMAIRQLELREMHEEASRFFWEFTNQSSPIIALVLPYLHMGIDVLAFTYDRPIDQLHLLPEHRIQVSGSPEC